jgi:integrase/recombinase XerD
MHKGGKKMNHFEHYLQVRETLGLSESTLQTEKESHERLWCFLNYPKDILDITKQNFISYAEHLVAENLKPNTRRKLLGSLRAFYQYAVKEGWIYQSPMNRIALPSKQEEPPKVLSFEQIKILFDLPDLNTFIGLRDRTMMELMYSSALRRSEVLSIKLSDFSEDYRCIKVIGKGNKEAVLPVGKIPAHFLRFYCEEVLPKVTDRIHEVIFISFNSKESLKPKYLYQTIRDYGRKAQFKFDIGPHVFRYSIATHLAESGVDVRYIQEFLRHECPRTTTRYIEQGFKQLQSIHERTHPRAI